MFTEFTPADLVSILNSINVPVCFTVLVAGVVVIAIKRALQRAEDADRRMKHMEDMERLRLSNVKEVTQYKTSQDYRP